MRKCPGRNECQEWKGSCSYWIENEDESFCSKIKEKKDPMSASELYALMQDFYMLIAESEPNLENLSEAMEELEELKIYLSEKITILKSSKNQDKKYTLKQLHQAWGAGRLSAENI